MASRTRCALALGVALAGLALVQGGPLLELSTPGGVTVRLNPADGSFAVLVDGATWLETAKTGPARVYNQSTM